MQRAGALTLPKQEKYTSKQRSLANMPVFYKGVMVLVLTRLTLNLVTEISVENA